MGGGRLVKAAGEIYGTPEARCAGGRLFSDNGARFAPSDSPYFALLSASPVATTGPATWLLTARRSGVDGLLEVKVKLLSEG